MDNATAFQEEKMLFERVKSGFESGDATIKKEAQLLATNAMKSKRKAYENASVGSPFYHVMVVTMTRDSKSRAKQKRNNRSSRQEILYKHLI